MYAELCSCGIFSPTNISLNMSAKKVIVFFPPYLSRLSVYLLGLERYCVLKILRFFLPLLLCLLRSFYLLRFVVDWIPYNLFGFPVVALYNETATGLV